jgi:transposase IS116/IS110/IS902 family protein
MLDALVRGTTDPVVLADMAKGRMRAKIPALREALEGRFDELHALLIGAILAHLDFLDQQIETLSEAIEVKLAPFASAVDLLRTILGIELRTAENVIAEIGTDMTQFPSADHLASWRPVSGQPRIRRQTPLGQEPQGLHVAQPSAQRGRDGCHPHRRQLPAGALPAQEVAPWSRPCARSRQTLDAVRDLARIIP